MMRLVSDVRRLNIMCELVLCFNVDLKVALHTISRRPSDGAVQRVRSARANDRCPTLCHGTVKVNL